MNLHAIEPPVSDHPKCQDLVVAFGVEPEAGLLREQV